MKNIQNMDIEQSFQDLEECFRIRKKLLKTNEPLTIQEIGLIQREADDGSPLAEFIYGLYYLLNQNDEKSAEEW